MILLWIFRTRRAAIRRPIFKDRNFPRNISRNFARFSMASIAPVYNGRGESLRPANRVKRVIAGREIGPSTRIVTYVSRGFESMRGFDIFMRTAKLIAKRIPRRPIFLIIGTDRIAYGGDNNHIPKGQTFKDWVLSQDTYDPNQFFFTGRIEPADLAQLLAMTDLHIYLTVPFVLSWSLLDAMSCQRGGAWLRYDARFEK